MINPGAKSSSPRPLLLLPLAVALIVTAVHTLCAVSTYTSVSRARVTATTDLDGLAWVPLMLIDLPATFVGSGILEFVGVRSRGFDDDFYTLMLIGIFGGIQWFLISFVGGCIVRAVYSFFASNASVPGGETHHSDQPAGR